MDGDGVEKGIIISTLNFHQMAKEQAIKNNIELF